MTDIKTNIDLTRFSTASRLMVEATLRVAPGTNGRFQPTGFPDQGAALYLGIRPKKLDKATQTAKESGGASESESLRILMVQSAAAIGNGLEEVCLIADHYNEDCSGIPYVRVLDGHGAGNPFLTSSVREPHRLASPYVLSAKESGGNTYKKALASVLGVNKQRPVRTWELARKLFAIDPGCVLHGIFLEELDGRLRLARLVSGFIEASNPSTANYGGVYRGEVTAKDNIPFARQEFISDDITATFVFHLSTMRGYGLKQGQEQFLALWALYKIDRFLRSSLRLRTACEFELAPKTGIKATLDGISWPWPAAEDIKSDLTNAKRESFPERGDENDEWKRRNVTVLVYRSEIPPTAVEAPKLNDTDFQLDGFEGRATFKKAHNFGTRAQKDERSAIELSGDWDATEFTQLMEQNPEKNGEGEVNPGYAVLKGAIKKHEEKLEARRKKERGD